MLLAINPVALALALLIRVFLPYEAHVSEGFGLISILAAAWSSTLHLLQGAGISGKLSKEMKMSFDVQHASDYKGLAQELGKVRIVFREGGKSSGLRKGEIYGRVVTMKSTLLERTDSAAYRPVFSHTYEDFR